MSDKMMKIAGRFDDGTAKGLHVNSSGDPINNHIWENVVKWMLDVTPTDTNTIDVGFDANDRLFVSKYAIGSLRFFNNTGVTVRVRFKNDITYTNRNNLSTLDGDNIELLIPSSSTKMFVVGPADVPILNYIHNLKFTCEATETPTNIPSSGTTLQIAVVLKR